MGGLAKMIPGVNVATGAIQGLSGLAGGIAGGDIGQLVNGLTGAGSALGGLGGSNTGLLDTLKNMQQQQSLPGFHLIDPTSFNFKKPGGM